MYLNLTSRCNSNCVYCEVRSLNQNDDLSSERILGLLSEAKELGIRKVYLSGGEPFLHQDFWEIVEKAKTLGIKLSAVSNGIMLGDLSLDKIKKLKYFDDINISLESHKEELHNKLRGGNFFQKTVSGIKILKASGVKVNISTVISNENYLKLEGIIKLAKELGADYINFQPIHVWSNYENVESISGKGDLLVESENFEKLENRVRRALQYSKKIKQSTNLPAILPWLKDYFLAQKKAENNKIWMRNIVKNFQCIEVFHKLFIHSNGALLPCAMLSARANVKNNSLKEAVKSLDGFKNDLRQGKFSPECNKCSCQLAPNYSFSVLNSPFKNFSIFIKILKNL
jgi:MoaA/NifB/PqqE/SkfB family radical SAM enzyme